MLFNEVRGLSQLVKPLDFLHRPSPITEEKRLCALWDLKTLHIKRDDLLSTVYGGSKTRMLEYFFGRAKMQGKNTVASMGPYVSHQMLGIGTYAKELGMDCRGILAPQPDHEEIQRYKTYYDHAGIQSFRCKNYFQIPVSYIKARWGKRNTYWIPPGGNDPYGVLALVDAAFEFAEQINSGLIPMPQDVVVPTGTCATAAGLYLGFSMLKLPIRVVAVRMVPMLWTSSKKLINTAKKGLKVLRQAGYQEKINWGELLWVNDHAYPGYGLSNDIAEEAMAEVRSYGNFRTELTYTGKSLAIFKGDLLRNRKVVFWNTYSAVDPQLL